MTTALTVLLALAVPAALPAHHSLAEFDTTTPVRVKGTIVGVHYITPHSFIYVEAPDPDGRYRRWAAEGPGAFVLGRRGFDKNRLNVGDVIDVCGYLLRGSATRQIGNSDHAAKSVAERLIAAEALVLADGSLLSWEDYGFHHCFPPGYRDHHQPR
jgi:hypothetical protein